MKWIASLASVLLLAQAAGQSGRLGWIALNKPFPEILMPTLDGTPQLLSQYRGKKIVLHVFASW